MNEKFGKRGLSPIAHVSPIAHEIWDPAKRWTWPGNETANSVAWRAAA